MNNEDKTPLWFRATAGAYNTIKSIVILGIWGLIGYYALVILGMILRTI
jgi:hypothetical protein